MKSPKRGMFSYPEFHPRCSFLVSRASALLSSFTYILDESMRRIDKGDNNDIGYKKGYLIKLDKILAKKIVFSLDGYTENERRWGRDL